MKYIRVTSTVTTVHLIQFCEEFYPGCETPEQAANLENNLDDGEWLDTFVGQVQDGEDITTCNHSAEVVDMF